MIHTSKMRKRKEEEERAKKSLHIDQSLAATALDLSIQHLGLQERFYKSDAFKKRTMH
jgi:hypothetical protein